ncbi:molecular chaperone [Providencia alcalifaciens]|uniref:fimbrial biogenesis chaperone n=1 Tax=Providencia alcalifaciens TaxID=126385 RepID=UPI001CC44937|nr:molecular chaperone [Providencia alcalifaciens]CAG9435396.1 Chaperone protein FimC [Providencia alcalifaciens]CAG9436242.1 Chaperone protein FimC [Providencia alcalifaciens]CAG9436255.1 Chaperone protein FimC [Providencia alcalifaciens]CAG9436277.1 Chaperone protein FimC [Providencia alcalifaciens]CAG9437530.1 Chaperone protein FimC [Providencia alcalifaciens]
MIRLKKFMMACKSVALVGLSLVMTSVVASDGGITLGNSTRIIFNGDEKRVSFPASNDTEQDYVFHGQVLTKQLDQFSRSFIVSPEVVHLKAGESKQIQIVLLGGDMPQDRESLFYLQGHFLPSDMNSADSTVGMRMSYVLQMKLFYRPEKLKASFDAVDKVADQLSFEFKNKILTVTNRSPYYLTLNSLFCKDIFIPTPDDKSMLEPFSNVSFAVELDEVPSLTWTLLNDGGFTTEPQTKKL